MNAFEENSFYFDAQLSNIIIIIIFVVEIVLQNKLFSHRKCNVTNASMVCSYILVYRNLFVHKIFCEVCMENCLMFYKKKSFSLITPADSSSENEYSFHIK